MYCEDKLRDLDDKQSDCSTDVPGNSNSVESVPSVDLAVLTDPEAEEEIDDNVKLPYILVSCNTTKVRRHN